MKFLLTGAKGQLGQDFNRIATAAGHNVIGFDSSELDITDPSQVEENISKLSPDFVLNAAAYTAVDKAEENPLLAYSVNHIGALNVAHSCADLNIPMFHISTDYVFDGEKKGPYNELDTPNPLSVYGHSKWKGEQAVRDTHNKHLIVRISWTFGVFGHNFVKTIQRLARERDNLRIVADQHGCPTATRALSHTLLTIAKQAINNEESVPWGTYHYCCQPPTTWYEFASAIIEESRQRERLKVITIDPITTQQFPTPAQRPENSVFDCDKIMRAFGIKPANWHDELLAVIKELD